MIRISLIIAIVTATILSGVPAGAGSCHRAASFLSVPHDRPSPITLEAGRVTAVDGDTITYDLGRETITIQAESFAARRFARDVAAGRCSAQTAVVLEPVRKSPFNTRFQAIDPRDTH